MGDLKRLLMMLCIAVAVSSCIGKNFKEVLEESKNAVSGNLGTVANEFDRIDFLDDNNGSVSHFQIAKDRPDYTLFLFSSATCGTCKLEHLEISKRLQGEKPEGFEIFSFMIGIDPIEGKEKLLKFRQDWQITWPFTGDPNKNMYNTYCQGVQVPCTVIFNKSGKKIYSHIGKIHAKDLEKHMKGVKIGKEPLPPEDLGDNAFFGRFIKDTRMFGQKNEEGDIEYTEKVLDENLDKPLLLLMASRLCKGCEEEHEKLMEIYNSSSTILKEIDIITTVLPYDATTEKGQEKINKDWINKFNLPWPVTGLAKSDIGKYLEDYCHPADPDQQGITPCTALYVPGKGIVMQRGEASISTILSSIRKHLKPIHFEENIEAITEIPERPESAVFETVNVSSDRDDRPIVLIYDAKFCGGCIEEHKKLVELYEDPNSFVHNVRLVSLVRGYDMDSEKSRNSFVKTWKIGFQVPWEMAIIANDKVEKSMDQYCKDADKDKQGVAPCTSIFMPEHGKVFERASMHVEDIGKVVNGEEIPPYKDDQGDLELFTSEERESTDKE